MKREEFYQRAVLELAGAMATQSGAWKVQLDKVLQMAEYLTYEVYGEWILPTHTPTTHTPIVAP